MYSLCQCSLRGSRFNLVRFPKIYSKPLLRLVHTADDASSGSTAEKIRTNFAQSPIPPNIAEAKSQLLCSLKEIQLSDTKLAPKPIFWSGIAGLIPIVLPPVSFFLFGYSNLLATCQMTFAATISAFLSGTRYGTHVSRTETASWPETLMSILPQFVSFGALMLPQIIGFPLITLALAINGFLDLTSRHYPPWFKAIRLSLTVPVITSLLVTCVFKMFN